VLQRRPNTFAQTILSPSFFACDKAADHTFRFARQNEAARAADATACIDTSLGTALLKNGWRRR
jgi:hypothetical protein